MRELEQLAGQNVKADIWEQRAFLAKVTGTAPNLIYVFNHKSQSNEYANRSVGESLGYSIREIQAMGEALLPTIIHPDDLAKIPAHFDVLRNLPDGEVAQLEYRIKHKDGGWVWLLAYDTVFQRDESGQLLRHLGVATDITQQKLAQEMAIEEQRVAAAANEELQTFAYAISHDMKAPSNTLNLLLAELKESHGDSLNPDAAYLLDLSLETVQRMRGLVDDVLNYTRVVCEGIELSCVDLQKLFLEIVAGMKAEITQTGADVQIDSLPVVQGSELHLRILFQNLIKNSLKFQQKESKPQVLVFADTGSGDGLASIHVKDNGIGIAPEHQQKIFEMFKRLHIAEQYPGTGLGLAICRRIALSHGGRITVDSELGGGSTFTVALKVAIH